MTKERENAGLECERDVTRLRTNGKKARAKNRNKNKTSQSQTTKTRRRRKKIIIIFEMVLAQKHKTPKQERFFCLDIDLTQMRKAQKKKNIKFKVVLRG